MSVERVVMSVVQRRVIQGRHVVMSVVMQRRVVVLVVVRDRLGDGRVVDRYRVVADQRGHVAGGHDREEQGESDLREQMRPLGNCWRAVTNTHESLHVALCLFVC